jgi:hypothetical protein
MRASMAQHTLGNDDTDPTNVFPLRFAVNRRHSMENCWYAPQWLNARLEFIYRAPWWSSSISVWYVLFRSCGCSNWQRGAWDWQHASTKKSRVEGYIFRGIVPLQFFRVIHSSDYAISSMFLRLQKSKGKRFVVLPLWWFATKSRTS